MTAHALQSRPWMYKAALKNLASELSNSGVCTKCRIAKSKMAGAFHCNISATILWQAGKRKPIEQDLPLSSHVMFALWNIVQHARTNPNVRTLWVNIFPQIVSLDVKLVLS